MIRVLSFVCLLATCTQPVTTSPIQTDVLITMGEIETTTSGACFARTVPPTRIDIAERLEQVAPETRDTAGTIIAPPVFRTITEPTPIVIGSGTRFQTVCPPVLTRDFVQSLQRALLVRRAYSGPITGLYDDLTRASVQQFQRDRGIDSPLLSVAAAQALGIFAQGRP